MAKSYTKGAAVVSDGKNLQHVTIYTDGACEPNPGTGGYGVVLLYGSHDKMLWGGRQNTTNNRMELLAAIEGLKALKYACKVTLYSDSQYLVNGIMKGWAESWRRSNWFRYKGKRSSRGPVPNADLWDQMLHLCEYHVVELVWLRGHDGDTYNEQCDQLAYEASRARALPIDVRAMPVSYREPSPSSLLQKRSRA
jgi:ribonuclease HI